MRSALEHIHRVEPQLRAFRELHEARAVERARRIDADRAQGRRLGALAGVTVALKDNICTAHGRTTCGSRMLAEYRSPYDATVVRRIEAEDAIVVGKTNCDEFAMGSSTENSAFGPTHNPWDTTRVPGGTSGGSAAAVAARQTHAALGSDTGGSIRQPAAFCGVVGLKPSYGRVSRFGLVAHGSSLDQIGPLATCVEDAALLTSVIAGPDASDATSSSYRVGNLLDALSDSALDARRAALRIAVPREYFGPGLTPEVRSCVEAALAVFERLGARRIDVSLPLTPYCIPTYYVIATAEASSNLARFDGVHYGRRSADGGRLDDLVAHSRRDGLGDEVKRRIMLGTFALSAGYQDAYYERALRVRRLIRDEFARVFEQADVIACPTTPSAAFRLGEKVDDPLQMYLADVYTTAANLACIPGISIPCGFSPAGLPIGLQLMGPAFGEEVLLQAARLYERETRWNLQAPPIAGVE